MANLDVLNRSVLDTALNPAIDGFVQFKAGLAATHDAYRSGGEDQPFRARLTVTMIGDIIVTAGFQSASRMVRSRDRIGTDGIDYITFMMLRSGRAEGTAGRPFAVSAPQIIMYDLTQPMDVSTTDNENVGVRIPRTSLTGLGMPLQALHGLVLDPIAGSILGAHLCALTSFGAALRVSDAAFVAGSTIGVVLSCLRAGSDWRTGASTAVSRMRDAAVRHIEANLRAPDLSPASVQEALGLSRSALYRLFDSGGPSAYIRSRRLDAIHGLLSNGDERSQADLAYEYRFANVGHFSRAFRRQFGTTPGRVKQGRSASVATPIAGGRAGIESAYERWLTGLRLFNPVEPAMPDQDGSGGF